MSGYFFGERLEGLSAQAIAGWGRDHPHDPSDLSRCVNFCKRMGLDTAAVRERMAGRSIYWDRLLPEWDHLVELLATETARPDGMAPRTYIEMRRVLENGTPCTDCDSTGRGAQCAKCKGTGRRAGGRRRAENCWRGAALCSTCSGSGYLTTTAKAS